jgi:teichuronic acid biosynthesis glycosyltransferase TuaG
METKLVSVIMPMYNASSYVKGAVESVFAQTYTQWELILIDDCSQDDTLTIVDKVVNGDPRVRIIRLDNNHGAPAGPRNIGIRSAKGKWVAFLDPDDIWHPEKLTHQVSALIANEMSFCSTRMTDFYDEDSIHFTPPIEYSVDKITFKKQRLKGRIPTSSVVIDREIMLAMPFNESFAYKAVEDYECWLRVHAEHGTSIKLLFPFLMYRRIEGQISESKMYMLGRIFMVHVNYPDGNILKATTFAISHLLGGIYFRFLKREL